MNKISARLIVCILGLILSIYAFYVEHVKLTNSDYEALCDVSSVVSCSVVFTSKYGKGFGIVEPLLGKDHYLNQPNSVFGLMFYTIQMIGAVTTNSVIFEILYWTTFGSIFVCMYLAYILAFVLHDFCIVCVGTYVLTIALHYLNYRSRKQRVRSSKKRN